MCEARQTDWIVRVTPKGLEELGERSAVPELDAIDELFDRLIHGRPATGLATPAATESARRIVREVRAQFSAEDWKSFPNLGMMEWTATGNGSEKVFCLATDNAGANLFRLTRTAGSFLITGIEATKESCEK
jgi:hypothetical protein